MIGLQRGNVKLMPSNNALHRSCKQVTDLLNRVKDTLPGLPGFRTLSLFGSLAEGRADDYSDVDVIVTTDDLPNAKAHLLSLLEQIGPVDFCWAINLRPDEWNPMIVFREENYFHKLDLGLAGISGVNRTIPPEQTILLCDQFRTPGTVAKESQAYVPQDSSMGHFLLGQLLGCLRYIKARKRGQILTCYRFAAAAVDWRLALLYARLTENPQFRSKLSTVDFLELDRMISPDDHSAFLSGLDFSTLAAMDSAVRTAADGMLEDGRYLAAASGEVLPAPVFERISAFLEEELQCATDLRSKA